MGRKMGAEEKVDDSRSKLEGRNEMMSNECRWTACPWPELTPSLSAGHGEIAGGNR